MRNSSKPPVRFIRCSGQIVLKCPCGEMVVLLGRLSDWYLEKRALFECGCGRTLTLASRIYEEEEALVVEY